MVTNFTVRMASKKDLNSIQQLVTACDIDDFNTGEFVINIEETLESIPLENTCVILNKNEIIVGYAFFIIGEYQDNKVWVDLLGTKRSARRRGVGSTLLKTMFSKAYEKGYRNVSLTVDDSSITKANRLYVNAGMKAVFQIGMYGKDIL